MCSWRRIRNHHMILTYLVRLRSFHCLFNHYTRVQKLGEHTAKEPLAHLGFHVHDTIWCDCSTLKFRQMNGGVNTYLWHTPQELWVYLEIYLGRSLQIYTSPGMALHDRGTSSSSNYKRSSPTDTVTGNLKPPEGSNKKRTLVPWWVAYTLRRFVSLPEKNLSLKVKETSTCTNVISTWRRQ